MQRRTLLQTLAAALAAPLFARRAGAAAAVFRRIRPGDADWPTPARWEALRASLSGELIAVKPLFPSAEAQANIENPFYVGDQAAGTETSGWLDAWSSAPSVFAVKARNSRDVAAAVGFARDNRLRLVVKGGGHSYLGTSNAPDSLLVWTRAMNDVTLHDAFVGRGCEGKMAAVPAVSAGAGALWIDLYDVVTTKAGRYVQGGGCTSVGVAGLVQSGGFGSYSKNFGTAAAGLLEAELVTADGRIRVVNACSDPDLFWALKGGGGGSFGVVTRVTLRTHDLPATFGGAWGTLEAADDTAFRRLLAQIVTHYAEHLFNPHWGEKIHVGPGNRLDIDMASQGLDKTQSQAAWQGFIDWIAAHPADYRMTKPFSTGVQDARDEWRNGHAPWQRSDDRPGAPSHHFWWRGDGDQVGVFIHGYESLWLPASLLRAEAGRLLADGLFAASRFKKVELHINKGLAGAPAEAIAAARDTATNPAVTESFALAIIADGEGPAFPGMARRPIDMEAARRDARRIDLATAELRRITPDSGSYVSESNFFNASWPREYWGGNYARLRAIKAKYDPEGLFFVHHGVGSEDWSPDGFVRLT